MKRHIFFTTASLISLFSSAQSLEKMNWFNEPSEWNINGNTLTMAVTPDFVIASP